MYTKSDIMKVRLNKKAILGLTELDKTQGNVGIFCAV